MKKEITNLPEKELPIKPLTKKEIHEASSQRVSLLTKEFMQGFELITKYPKSVTFFGSARFEDTNKYYIKARSTASKIVNDIGYSIVTGGGPGIMEAGNRGAFESGGNSIGLTIQLPHEQVVNPYLTSQLDFYYFFARKVCLNFAAESYLFFPGGFGTMDELFGLLTLIQTHKVRKVPVILVGKEFWQKQIDGIFKQMLDEKVIDKEDLSLFTITDDEEEILEIIKNAPVVNSEPFDIKKIEKEKSALSMKKCIPCHVDTKPLNKEEAEKFILKLDKWSLVEDKFIEKIIIFKDFTEAMFFFDKVGAIAEEEGHHPNISIFDYNKVKITLTTHNIGGLSENDFIMAAKIDEVNNN